MAIFIDNCSMNNLIVKKADPEHLEELRILFRDTIQAINAKDYSTEQIEVWSEGWKHTQRWQEMMDNQSVLISVADYKVIGFSSLTKEGLVDFFYVHADYQRCGTGKKLMQAIEGKAIELGIKKLHSDVSKTALPFFLKMGFVKTGEHSKNAGNVVFVNNLMQKIIE